MRGQPDSRGGRRREVPQRQWRWQGGQWGAEGPPKKFIRCQSNGAGQVREGSQGPPRRTAPSWLRWQTGSLLGGQAHCKDCDGRWLLEEQ